MLFMCVRIQREGKIEIEIAKAQLTPDWIVPWASGIGRACRSDRVSATTGVGSRQRRITPMRNVHSNTQDQEAWRRTYYLPLSALDDHAAFLVLLMSGCCHGVRSALPFTNGTEGLYRPESEKRDICGRVLEEKGEKNRQVIREYM